MWSLRPSRLRGRTQPVRGGGGSISLRRPTWSTQSGPSSRTSNRRLLSVLPGHHTYFKYNSTRNAYDWRGSRRQRARGGALWKDPTAASRMALNPPGRVLLCPGARPIHRSRPGCRIRRSRKADGRRHTPAGYPGQPGLLSGRREVSHLRRAQKHLPQGRGTGRRGSTSAQTPRIARSPWKSKACSPPPTAASPGSECPSKTRDGTTHSRWSIPLGLRKLKPRGLVSIWARLRGAGAAIFLVVIPRLKRADSRVRDR